jgi:chaperonin cofactor prefoldin
MPKDDLVERARNTGGDAVQVRMFAELADEIERLRARIPELEAGIEELHARWTVLELERHEHKTPEDLYREVGEALGEVSALFMSNELPGTSQIMPTSELERIGHDLMAKVSRSNHALREKLEKAKGIMCPHCRKGRTVEPVRRGKYLHKIGKSYQHCAAGALRSIEEDGG